MERQNCCRRASAASAGVRAGKRTKRCRTCAGMASRTPCTPGTSHVYWLQSARAPHAKIMLQGAGSTSIGTRPTRVGARMPVGRAGSGRQGGGGAHGGLGPQEGAAGEAGAVAVQQGVEAGVRKGGQHNGLAQVAAPTVQVGVPHAHDVGAALLLRHAVQRLKDWHPHHPQVSGSHARQSGRMLSSKHSAWAKKWSLAVCR